MGRSLGRARGARTTRKSGGGVSKDEGSRRSEGGCRDLSRAVTRVAWAVAVKARASVRGRSLPPKHGPCGTPSAEGTSAQERDVPALPESNRPDGDVSGALGPFRDVDEQDPAQHPPTSGKRCRVFRLSRVPQSRASFRRSTAQTEQRL